MKPRHFPSNPTKPWVVQLRGSLSPKGDRKRKSYYFKSKEAAEKFCVQVRKKGLAALSSWDYQRTSEQSGPVIQMLLNEPGCSVPLLVEAWNRYKRECLAVKPGVVSAIADEFALARKKKVALRTWNEDNWRLNKLTREFAQAQLSHLTEADLRRFFDRLPGHTRSIYKTVKVFFRWAKDYGYLAVDPMAGIRPVGDWGVRKGIYPITTFEKMLRIAAGLEGCLPGEQPTRRFAPLLPWFALSGFCGLRSCEAIPRAKGADAIRWDDLHWDREFIEIRESVAKMTRRSSDGRHIETAHYLAAAKAWLDLCLLNRHNFIVPVYDRTICKLKSEFTRSTGIKFVENGFRNSFASYSLAYDGKESVGKLALEMGNSESVCKRFYVKTLEPRTGRAWFSLRPQGPANVVPIGAAA